MILRRLRQVFNVLVLWPLQGIRDWFVLAFTADTQIEQLQKSLAEANQKLEAEALARKALLSGIPQPSEKHTFVLAPDGEIVEATEREVITEMLAAKQKGAGVNLVDITPSLEAWNRQIASKKGSAMVKWDPDSVMSKLDFDTKGHTDKKVYIAVTGGINPENFVREALKRDFKKEGIKAYTLDNDGEKIISSMNLKEFPGEESQAEKSDPLRETAQDKAVDYLTMRDPLEILQKAREARAAFGDSKGPRTDTTFLRDLNKALADGSMSGRGAIMDASDLASWVPANEAEVKLRNDLLARLKANTTHLQENAALETAKWTYVMTGKLPVDLNSEQMKNFDIWKEIKAQEMETKAFEETKEACLASGIRLNADGDVRFTANYGREDEED